MFELPQLPPPPWGVKYSVPGPGNETRRETSDFYSGVIAVLTSRWRVITCRNGIQWILQRREGLHGGAWRGFQYFCSKDALLRTCGGLGLLSSTTKASLEGTLSDNFGKGMTKNVKIHSC